MRGFVRGRAAVLMVVALATLLVGCSADQPAASADATPAASGYPGWPGPNPDVIPVPVSTELVVGSNRFLLNLIDQQDNSLVSPDRSVQMSFYDLAVDPATPVSSAAGTYLDIAPGRPGLYRAQVNFDQSGEWGVEVVTSDTTGQHTGRMIFNVTATGTTPAIGAPAIPEDTPTASTPDQIALISTDPTPDPDFYKESIAQALAAHQPFLVIFATPAFCVSQTCGPALDVVKSVAPDFKAKVTFIHVEPYQLKTVDGALQPVLSSDNTPVPIQAVTDYGLPLEPYIFVVDASGKVAAKFEGVAGADELRSALTAVSGG